MLTSYFRICKIWVLPLKTDMWNNVCESARVMKLQVYATCFWKMDRQCNIDEMKYLNKNIYMTGSIKPFN